MKKIFILFFTFYLVNSFDVNKNSLKIFLIEINPILNSIQNSTLYKSNNGHPYVSEYFSHDRVRTLEEVKEDLADATGKAKKAAKEIKEAATDAKATMKKAVKSAAQDIMSKAEDKARGVGLVKDEKEASEFEFEDFDKGKSGIDIE